MTGHLLTAAAACLTLSCSTHDDVYALYNGVPTQVDPCQAQADALGGVVALYEFDGDQGTLVTDWAGQHPGQVSGGSVMVTDGPSGCGKAFDFGDGSRFIVVPDSPAWDLSEGSVDFWFRSEGSVSTPMGIVSRDAELELASGHLSAWIVPGDFIVARLQTTEQTALLCSGAVLEAGSWTHVVFDFGPPGLVLSVGGDTSTRTGNPGLAGPAGCGGDLAAGIAGNDLPWVIGRSSYFSTAPPAGLTEPLVGAAIDGLRISSVRRTSSL